MQHLPTFVRVAVALCLAAAATACASSAFLGPDGDRRFYEARCGACHVAYPRDDYAPSEWPKILDVMAPRAGLTSSQRERVLRYVTTR